MKRICRTYQKEFDGANWMEQCYDCYKDFKGQERISTVGDETTVGVVILSHPDCTKAEINSD